MVNGCSARGKLVTGLIYVLEGQIRLTQVDKDGLSHQVGMLKPGDTAGETGLMVGDFHDVTATALWTDAVFYTSTGRNLLRLLQTETRLRERLDIRAGYPYNGASSVI